MARVRYIIDKIDYRDNQSDIDNYINKYGYHFNDKVCDFAVNRMFTNKGKITPYTIQQVDEMLNAYGIKIKNLKGYDHVFVANMGQADYLYSSIKDESYLAKYIKDVLDDPDGYEGIAFVRWLADINHTNVKINWNEMI